MQNLVKIKGLAFAFTMNIIKNTVLPLLERKMDGRK